MNSNIAAACCKILADPTRVNIVLMLNNGTMCACEILSKLHITQPTLSYHMKLLTKHKFVTFVKKGTWVHYSLEPTKINELFTFLTQTHLQQSAASCTCNGANA